MEVMYGIMSKQIFSGTIFARRPLSQCDCKISMGKGAGGAGAQRYMGFRKNSKENDENSRNYD